MRINLPPMRSILAAVLGGLLAAIVPTRAYSALPPRPPTAPVRSMVDDYFGTKAVDPYRYMENLNDPQVQTWMKKQNDYTRAVLALIPGRPKLLAEINAA